MHCKSLSSRSYELGLPSHKHWSECCPAACAVSPRSCGGGSFPTETTTDRTSTNLAARFVRLSRGPQYLENLNSTPALPYIARGPLRVAQLRATLASSALRVRSRKPLSSSTTNDGACLQG